MNITGMIKNNRFSLVNFSLILFLIIGSCLVFVYLNSKVNENSRILSIQKTEVQIVKDTVNEITLNYAKIEGKNLAVLQELSNIEKQLVTFNEYNEKIVKIIKESTTNIPEIPKLPELPKAPEILKPTKSQPSNPSVAKIPKVSEVSKIPETSKVSELPQLPELPIVPDLLKVPELPQVPELPKLSNEKFFPPPPPPPKDRYKFLKPWKWF